ncbi:unnamed protein product, partial [Rotaria sp. Silwood1]
MADVSLASLPPELLYHIFDNIDVQTIYLSLRRVCKKFYDCIDIYDRRTLNYDSSSQRNIDVISRFLRPETVLSLTIIASSNISQDSTTSFHQIFNIDQFTRLHSLTLDNVDDT